MPPSLELPAICRQLDDDGYALIPRAFTPQTCQELIGLLQATLAHSSSPAIQRRGDVIYGARDLLEVFPAAKNLWLVEPLQAVLQATLGSCGLVRGLYFDKPPGATWSLPWHRDLTIAVKNNGLPSSNFRHPTTKAGIPHVEAPSWLLERMLTLRIHLDPMTDANGPLRVAPGSHILPRATPAHEPITERAEVVVHADAGDVLAMRPLLFHSSAGVQADASETTGEEADAPRPMHRRVLHLEFCSERELPDGYAWRDFIPMPD